MKHSLFYIIFALISIITLNSCESRYSDKDNIYAEKHKIYSIKDTLYSNITVYYAKVNGHNVVYHVYSGNKKGNMEVWHFKEDCKKCKSGK